MAEKIEANVSPLMLTAPADSFFHPVHIASEMLRLTPPLLVWDEFIPIIDIPVKEFMYLQESASGTRYNPSTDPRKRHPAQLGTGVRFPRITVSGFQQKHGYTERLGFSFEADEEVRGQYENQRVSWVNRMTRQAAYAFAELINSDMITALTNDFSVTNTDDTGMEDYLEHSTDFGTETTVGHLAGKLSSDYYWDEEGADPVTDIMDLAAVISDQPGYPFVADRVYMHNRELHWLNKFVINNGGSWQQSPLGFGYRSDMIAGIDVIGLQNVSGFEFTTGDGYILMVDSNNPAGETYRNMDNLKPAVGNGFNFNAFEENETHDWVYQIWNRRSTVVREPLSMAVLQVRD